MPVHHFIHDHHLADKGLRNYWGYNSIGFFAPHGDYSAWGVEQVVSEFKYLVKTMHEAGIEVILDVVYNHTAEGNHLGPLLSFKGIDNPAYYRLADGGRYYFDTTGTGNTLNMRHPHVLQLIIDSLRYWVTEMHVDGFRFDLAASLARQFHEVDRLSAFFDLIQVDPVVSPGQADRRAVGPRRGRLPGRQLPDPVVGVERPLPRHRPRLLARRGPHPGRLRLPAHRQLRPVRQDRHGARTPASTSSPRTTGSPSPTWSPTTTSTTRPTARTTGTAPTTTARGTAARRARPTIPEVLATRERRRRALMTTLLLSQGVPMIRHGDEIGHSQDGNNNAYCQDNEISWLDWEHADRDFLAFCSDLVALPPPAPGVPAAPVLRGRAHLRRRAVRHRLVPAGRRGDDGRRLARGLRQVARASSSTATRCPTPTRAAGGCATTASCCCSTRTTTTSPSCFPARSGAAGG